MEWAGPLEAIELYDRILSSYPDYAYNDWVLYQKARAFDELGRTDEAIGVIEILVSTYPSSRYIDEVQFRRAEYFFTRKLMLIKESQAFVCLPGGVGTLDETFELLTLTQTGKGVPVPIVLLDEPGNPYWEEVDQLMQSLVRRGLVSAGDTSLYTITDSCEEACRIIDEFYANYDSIRFVRDHLVMRLHQAPDDQQLADLNERFSHLVERGEITRTKPFKVEERDDDQLELERITFEFTKHGYGDLIKMIGVLNSYVL